MDQGPAATDQLPALAARVIRGVNRLLLDPGLPPHHRVRLEIDLRLLTTLDLGDRRRASVELLRCLPRVIDIVESVTPFYFRLHTDLAALLDAATEWINQQPLRLFPLPPPSSHSSDHALPEGSSAMGRVGSHGALGGDLIRDRVGGGLGTAARATGAGWRWWRHRFRFAVAVLGLVAPVVVLAAGAFATGGIGLSVLALTGLCPVGAVAGVVARALVHPELLPPAIAARLDPPPDRTAIELHRAAAEAWFAYHDDPVGV